MKQKTIGIIGGMGPYATIDMFKRIVDLTPAKRDWEHYRIIIDNNAKIPARTRHFLYNEESPVKELINSAQSLERAGADFLIIGCGTSYYWVNEIRKEIKIPIIDMYVKLRNEILKNPNIKKVGLLTADVVYDLKLVDKYFDDVDIEIIHPSEKDIKIIRNAIEKIKVNDLEGNLQGDLHTITINLKEKGADAIIVGCTELQIVFNQTDTELPLYDVTDILVKSAIKEANGITSK